MCISVAATRLNQSAASPCSVPSAEYLSANIRRILYCRRLCLQTNAEQQRIRPISHFVSASLGTKRNGRTPLTSRETGLRCRPVARNALLLTFLPLTDRWRDSLRPLRIQRCSRLAIVDACGALDNLRDHIPGERMQGRHRCRPSSCRPVTGVSGPSHRGATLDIRL